MSPKTSQVPPAHVIEEVEKHHRPHEEPLQLPLPLPLPPYTKPEPKKQGGSVIVIEL